MTPDKNEDKIKAITKKYDAPDAGIKVIVGMYANLLNAMYATIPSPLILGSVLNGKVIPNLVLDEFTHHSASNPMTRRI